MKNKKGQFFILAAVIISVILVGIVTTRNYISVREEPRRFFDLSEEIKSEAGEVIDFGVFQNVGADELKNLSEDFIVNVEEDFYANNPDNEFIFVYGDDEGFRVLNLAKESLIIDKDKIPGGNRQLKSEISDRILNARISVPGSFRNYNNEKWKKEISGKEEVTIKFNNQLYDFSLGKNQRFYLIMRRKVDDEVYITKK